MNENVDPRAATRASNAPKQDLRAWLAQMEAAGEVTHISGAEREREIGGIVDIYQRKIGNPLVLFDDIPGYPKGHRHPGEPAHLDPPHQHDDGQSARRHRDRAGAALAQIHEGGQDIPPVTVASGALLENVKTGDDIDLFKIPVPRWHEHDGGYYIGTGDMVIMRDPDTGWINYGAYRVQAHDKNLATVMCSKGKHGDMIQKKYHERGQPCPVAVVCGMHPALFMIAGLEIPHGKNEYDAAGGLLGEPVQVILGPEDRPADPGACRDRLRGLHPSERQIDEGPLGEWTGYYAGGLKKEPAIRIETMMYRDDPILLGAFPAFRRTTIRSTAARIVPARCGTSSKLPACPRSKACGRTRPGGSRLWLTVAIKQQYAGHSKQAGLIASQCHAGAYVNRFVVVVDDDIDPPTWTR
jgi:4-hydroxy-3-polyprenylbenzoate decarboxylase